MSIIIRNINNSIGYKGSPIEAFFRKGKYFVELYGASGSGSYPGRGGYSCGILNVNAPRSFFLYIGGQGKYNPKNDGKGTCIEGGWNGGGKACSYGYQTSGGGGTDIRLTKNDNYNDRIIIAGGGGGDGSGGEGSKFNDKMYHGGDGGGLIGGMSFGVSETSKISFGDLMSTGGTQEKGGECSKIMSYEGETYKNSNGKLGVGGDCAGGAHCCGSGGGGYYGGAGGFDITGGGGGSSYYNPQYIKNGKLLKSDHTGNGVIYITPITYINTKLHKYRYDNPLLLILVIIY